MRTKRYAATVFAAVMVMAGVAGANTVVTDQPSAILQMPGVVNGPGFDTIIQITNTSSQPVALKCYYVNAVGKCSRSGDPCYDSALADEFFGENSCPSPGDVCRPQWVETDFRVYMTARQPLAWLSSRGLPRQAVPVDGIFRQGPNGESNAGTDVPPFGDPVDIYRLGVGELKCYVINPDGTPSERNVIKGEMTIVTGLFAGLDTITHNAIGNRAIESTNNGDSVLTLGGPGAEYDACPNVLIVDHFFDYAYNPVDGNPVVPFLVLAPCTENFVTQKPTKVNVQYLVFNEFEQRFSTSKSVDCFFLEEMAFIDTSDPSRSIFSAHVAGTLTGQTRIRPVDGGLIGWAGEIYNGPRTHAASFNIHQQGERAEGDAITAVH